MDDIERLIAGQCCHGHKNFNDCSACVMTRKMVLGMRQMLSQLFRTNP